MKNNTSPTGLLTEVIEQLRSDLLSAAEKRPTGWTPLFDISEVQVELQTRARLDKKAKGGVRFYVISGEAELSEGSELAHKITVKLQPHSKNSTQAGATVAGVPCAR